MPCRRRLQFGRLAMNLLIRFQDQLLIGALCGAAAGAAMGGSVGAVSSASSEVALDDPRLDDFAASLAKDTSALILVGERASILDFTSAVEPFGGTVIETNLDEKDIKALRTSFKN